MSATYTPEEVCMLYAQELLSREEARDLLALSDLGTLREQLASAEDHIDGLCKELDSRAPGWENEALWYTRTSNQDTREG